MGALMGNAEIAKCAPCLRNPETVKPSEGKGRKGFVARVRSVFGDVESRAVNIYSFELRECGPAKLISLSRAPRHFPHHSAQMARLCIAMGWVGTGGRQPEPRCPLSRAPVVD
jgi:hypothetical protein